MRRRYAIAAAVLGAATLFAPLAAAAPPAARAERSGAFLERGPLPPRPQISARGQVVAVGTRLTASAGGWRSLARTGARLTWQMRDPGGTWSDIAGASGRPLTVPGSALGKQIRVVVRGGALAAVPGGSRLAAGDTGQRTSAPLTVRAPEAPRAVTPPSVAGSGVAGSRLVARTGVWRADPRPVLEVTWLRDGTPIPGAGGATYTPTSADAGHALSVRVAARNAGGSAATVSEPLAVRSAGPVPAPARPATRRLDTRPEGARRARARTRAAAPRVVSGPVVQGPVVVGSTLTSIPGVYRGSPRPRVVSYQWQRSSDDGRTWVPVPGGSGPTLALDPALLGDVIRLVETVRNPSGSAVARSNATSVVMARAPESTGAPVISGTPAAGATLVATGGTWTAAPAPSLAFQWQSSPDGTTWADLPGADSPDLVVGLTEVGLRLRVLVTASTPGGTALAASAPTAAVPAVAPASTSPPSVSGAPAVGSTMTVTEGGWSGDPAPGTSVQWYTAPEPGGPWSPLPGAASTTLLVPPAAAGLYLQAVVSATNAGGTATAASAAVGPVAADPPLPTALPVVGDAPATTPAPGGAAAAPGASAPYLDLLSATSGAWSEPAQITYQWVFQAAGGGGFTPVPGATGPTFQPSCAQVGGSVTVAVTAIGGGGALTVFAPDPVQVGDPDSDGDGLSNCAEVQGTQITVVSGDDLSSATEQVASSPLLIDTDSDALDDLVESTVATDPASADTDGDGLVYRPTATDGPVTCGQGAGTSCSSDWTEVTVYGSRPANADSDGDATQTAGGVTTVYPALFDGTEVSRWGTSPTLADTDGDAGFSLAQGALTDTTEVLVGDGSPSSAYNPLVAQVPEYSLTISDDVDVAIQYTETDQTSTQTATTQATITTSASQQKTGSDTTSTSELNWNVKAGAGKGEKGPSFSLDGNVGGRYATSVTTFNDTTTTAQLQQTAQTVLTQAQQNSVTYAADSTLSTTVAVTNTGQVSFALQDPVFLVQVPDPDNAGQDMTLATLTATSGTTAPCPGGGAQDCTATIEPGGQVQIPVSDTSVPTQQLIAYMTSPGSLTISAAEANLVNAGDAGAAAGQPFAGSIGQAINAQTAQLIVDPGSEGDGPVSLAVATNATRDAAGAPAGVALQQALGTAGLAVDTGTTSDGTDVALQVTIPGQGAVPGTPLDAAALTPESGIWSLFGASGGSPPAPTGDIAAAVLQQGDTVLLQFGRDQDVDGLLDGAEQQLGTSPTDPDTDQDGAAGACGSADYGCMNGTSYLSDFYETNVGWVVPLTVGTKPSYPVLSSPTTCDADGDASPDGPGAGTESAPCPDGEGPENARVPNVTGQGTDPTLPDTNLDGVTDGAEPAQAVLIPCPVGEDCLPPRPYSGTSSWVPFPGDPYQWVQTDYTMVPNPLFPGGVEPADEVAALTSGDPGSIDLFSTIDGDPVQTGLGAPVDGSAIATAADGSYWIAASGGIAESTATYQQVTATGPGPSFAFPPSPLAGGCAPGGGFRVADLAMDASGYLVAVVQQQSPTTNAYSGLLVVRWLPGTTDMQTYVADGSPKACSEAYLYDTALATLPSGEIALIAPDPQGDGLEVTILSAGLTAVTSWSVPNTAAPDATPSGWGLLAGIAADPQGYLYVSAGWGDDPSDPDAGGTVLKYNAQGVRLSVVAGSGAGVGQVSGAEWIGASADCRLLVQDTWNQRLDVFAYPLGTAGACPDAPTPPAGVAPPVITGTPDAGAAVACDLGAWSGDPSTFAYQWSAAGDAVPGATQDELTITAAMQGEEITCTVTAANAQGSASATSAPVTVPGGSG